MSKQPSFLSSGQETRVVLFLLIISEKIRVGRSWTKNGCMAESIYRQQLFSLFGLGSQIMFIHIPVPFVYNPDTAQDNERVNECGAMKFLVVSGIVY